LLAFLFACFGKVSDLPQLLKEPILVLFVVGHGSRLKRRRCCARRLSSSHRLRFGPFDDEFVMFVGLGDPREYRKETTAGEEATPKVAWDRLTKPASPANSASIRSKTPMSPS
jgi:hypothetical protein